MSYLNNCANVLPDILGRLFVVVRQRLPYLYGPASGTQDLSITGHKRGPDACGTNIDTNIIPFFHYLDKFIAFDQCKVLEHRFFLTPMTSEI